MASCKCQYRAGCQSTCLQVQHLAWIYKGVTRCMRSGDDEHRRIRSLWRYPPWHTSLAYVGMHTENTRGHGHVL
eukprot:scaffold269618_cov18-Tisochrysis_lutea.AAC.1